MAELFNQQRKIGVRILSDGATMYNNLPVIGVREAADGVLFIDNELVIGATVIEDARAIYNEQPVRGVVLISDARKLYGNSPIIPVKGAAPSGPVPVNTVLPVITGTFVVGEVLSVSNGTWSNAPTGYAYQWRRDGVAISGATTNGYTLVIGDVGFEVDCRVTATNENGTGFADAIGDEVAAGPIPVNTVAPTVTGSFVLGQTLNVTSGTWTNSPTGYTYQWRRDSAPISGETGTSYTLAAGDVGAYVDCRVTATNANGSAGANSNGATVTDVPVANIIGVAVTAGQATHARIDVDGTSLAGAEYNFGGTYYAGHGAFGLTGETIDGQAMIKVPAFWYRRATISGGANNGKQAWWVADREMPGFVRHPAFYKGGVEIDHFWVGKYQGVADGATKLASTPAAVPLVNLTHAVFKSRAAARNGGGQSGWMMWSWYQLAAIQMLAMIETASTDSQASIGQGRVSQSSAANVDAADVAQATYRGVVGLWGNVHQWIDGLDYASSIVRLWDRTGGKTWVATGLSSKPADNHILTANGSFGAGYDFRDVFFPLTTAAEASATWRDYSSTSYTADRLAFVGGSWSDGAVAGLWFLHCGFVASFADARIGSRLAKEP